MTRALKSISLMILLALAVCGCSSDADTQAKIRRAYAAGEAAAHAQMEQQQRQQQQQQFQQPQQPMQPMGSAADSTIRVLGHVRNPMFPWHDGLTLGRALVEAQYESNNTPRAITIYRNNQPLQIDPQRLLQGEDFPLYPGDTIWIQE